MNAVIDCYACRHFLIIAFINIGIYHISSNYRPDPLNALLTFDAVSLIVLPV